MLSHLFPARRKAVRRPSLEALEGRCLLAPHIVTSPLDDGSSGTLRAQIAAAAGDASNHTVTFSPSVSGQTIALSSTLTIISGAFTAASPLTIQADPGINLTLSGNNTNRVFSIAANVSLVLTATPKPAATTPLTPPSSIVVTNGTAGAGDGGGFLNNGLLTLTGVTVTGNMATSGGGIASEGTATQLVVNGNSTVVSNTAASGAGLFLSGAAGSTTTIDTSAITSNTGGGSNLFINAVSAFNTTVTNSTVSQGTTPGIFLQGAGGGLLTLNGDTFSYNNSGTFSGGGLEVLNGPTNVNVLDCTFVYNVSEAGGGALNFTGNGALTVINSTITNNVDTSAVGGGGIRSTANFNLANTVVAQNSSAGIAQDVSGTLENTTANGNNFIGNVAGFNANGTTVVGNGDSRLGALQNNGGPTLTRAPLPGSPLIDKGDNAKLAGLTLDQRGLPRVANGGVSATTDIGAVEFQPTATVSAVAVTAGAPAYRQFITYQVTVADAAVAAGTANSFPGGTVTFLATSTGGTTVNLGSAALDATGKATLTTALTPRGASTLVAVYNGDANFKAAASPPFAQNTKVTSYIGAVDSGVWYLRNSNSAGIFHYSFGFGLPSWKPVTGDWNGTGVFTPAAVDPTNNTWYIDYVNNSSFPAQQFMFGNPGWIPVSGDWTGSGHSGVGVVDPATMTWYVKDSATPGGAVRSFQFGSVGQIPVTGDWTGVLSASGFPVSGIGLFNPTNGVWTLRNSASAGATDFPPISFGAPNWKPVTGDWTGSGVTHLGVFDPSGNWYLAANNATGTALVVPPFAYGLGGYQPVSGDWGVDRLTSPLPQLPAPAAASGASTVLDQGTLDGVVAAALGRLAAAGVSAGVLGQLASAHYSVGQTGPALALTDVGTASVVVSPGAAGVGWFTDPSDAAFVGGRALPGSAAAGEYDLLTVVLHEMGHLRGWGEVQADPYSTDLRAEWLPTGLRRTDALDAIFGV